MQQRPDWRCCQRGSGKCWIGKLRLANTALGIIATTVLEMSSVAWAGELGYGFTPGLTAGTDYVAGQVIVGYQDDAASDKLLKAAQTAGGAVVKTLSGAERAVLLSFESEAQAVAAIPALRNQPGVQFVERNGLVRVSPPLLTLPVKGDFNRAGDPALGLITPTAVSTDPGTGFQWHLPVIRKTVLPPTLALKPPTVAVIDSGVDWTHPDLASRVIRGKNTILNNLYPFDDYGQGTHVAGLIAAQAGNKIDGEGVCPNCKILAIKVLNAGGVGTAFDIADGLEYARTTVTVPPVRVVNLSFGVPASALIAQKVLALKTAGKLLVAAAGDNNVTSGAGFPGADPNTALRVMATEQNDCRAWFSNFSPATKPTLYNIAAPGWQLVSTTPNLGYAGQSGTAMASAVVAGGAALVWGQLPTLNRDQLVTRLVNNGQPLTCGFASATRRLDVRKAIAPTVAETALIGRLLDPVSGKAPTLNTLPATVQLLAGATVLKADPTDRSGFYELTGLKAGTLRLLKGNRAAAPAYVNATVRNGMAITAGRVAGPYTDALPLAQAAGTATVTLDWKTTQPIKDTTSCTSACNGWELDLWVKLPSGVYVGWDNPGDLRAAPFVLYPRDSQRDQEPVETILLSGLAANGVYKVVAQNPWAGAANWNDAWTHSQASVQMYNGAAALGTFYPTPPATCGVKPYWHVGNLTKTGATYTWVSVNVCSNTRP